MIEGIGWEEIGLLIVYTLLFFLIVLGIIDVIQKNL
jgi:hypothetical protein